jgi:hypothetical protein
MVRIEDARGGHEEVTVDHIGQNPCRVPNPTHVLARVVDDGVPTSASESVQVATPVTNEVFDLAEDLRKQKGLCPTPGEDGDPVASLQGIPNLVRPQEAGATQDQDVKRPWRAGRSPPGLFHHRRSRNSVQTGQG